LLIKGIFIAFMSPFPFS